jgi:hypothetical protein
MNNILVRLHEIHHAAYVRFIQLLDAVERMVRHVQILRDGNVSQKFDNVGLRQLIKPEPYELVLESLVDLADVIADQAKSDIARVILQEVTQRLLGILRHVIHFIEDNKLHAVVEEGF